MSPKSPSPSPDEEEPPLDAASPPPPLSSAPPPPPMSAPPAPANDRWLFGAGLIGGLAVVAFVVLPTILAEVTGRGAVAVGGLGTRPAFGLILLLIVAAGLVWLFAHFWRSLPPMPAFSASPGGSAHEILRVRFARGEITQDEYLRMVEVLRT